MGGGLSVALSSRWRQLSEGEEGSTRGLTQGKDPGGVTLLFTTGALSLKGIVKKDSDVSVHTIGD